MARFGVGEKAFIYIADSALVTLKNLKQLSEGQPFITRLPATWDNKPTTSPSALLITSKFKNTTVILIGSQRRLNRPLNPVQREWLEALGLKPDTFTAQPRAG